MLHTNKAISYMDQLLIKKDKEIERTKKILADHNERIRILELAIQWCQGLLNSRTIPTSLQNPNMVNRMLEILSLDENRLKNSLNDAMTQSHEIALKEYPSA